MFLHCARTWTFKALEVNFLSAYLFQEYQDKCSSAINEVKIDLLSNFTALLLRSVQNQKTACNMHNFKLACYVYTLFKFPGE